MTAGEYDRATRDGGSAQATITFPDAHTDEPRPSPGPAVRTPCRSRSLIWIGALLTLLSLATLAHVGWQFVGTNLVSKHNQEVLREQTRNDWSDRGQSGDATEDLWRAGEGVALVRVPRFGDNYEMPLLAGTSEDDLSRGIGWFTTSARPGQLGNFAVAAHRVTHGEPFSHFLELREGDEVIIETRTHLYTYRLTEDGDARVVDFTQTWVLDPVPAKPAAEPEERLLTMVTCAEIFHTDYRNVVFGVLQSVDRK